MHKIFSGKDRAKELKLKNYRELIDYECAKTGERWNRQVDTNTTPVYAWVSWGRWLWTCECNDVHYAEPTDPIGFCSQCGNVFTDGKARPVIFPENIHEIEEALLEREVESMDALREKMEKKYGASQLMLMPQFRPKAIARDWLPGESVEVLKQQHEQAKENKKIFDEEKIKEKEN